MGNIWMTITKLLMKLVGGMGTCEANLAQIWQNS